MTSDEKTTALLVVGGGALVAGLAWLVWPRSAAAATPVGAAPVPHAPTPSTHSYAPQMEPPVAVNNAFLASAPPAGPSASGTLKLPSRHRSGRRSSSRPR